MKKKVDKKTDSDYSITVDTEEAGNEQIKKLREKLKKAVAEKQEYLDGWQRAKADLINTKRESEEQRAKTVLFATQSLITELLPILDSFELALSYKGTQAQEMMQGMEQVYKQFLSVLEAQGITQIRPNKEDAFDPAFHEAVETVEGTSGNIAETIQSGYTLHEKVLRPARVKVFGTQN